MKRILINLITSLGSLGFGIFMILDSDLWGAAFVVSSIFTMFYSIKDTIKSRKEENE